MADDSGNLYILSEYNTVYKVNKNGIFTTIAGTSTAGYYGDGGPATNAEFYNAINLALDKKGNIYTAYQLNNRKRKKDATNDT